MRSAREAVSWQISSLKVWNPSKPAVRAIFRPILTAILAKAPQPPPVIMANNPALRHGESIRQITMRRKTLAPNPTQPSP
jgi:hypothetical protein